MDILKYVAAVFLFYMAFKIATARPVDQSKQLQINPPTLIHGALAQGVNPKAWLVSASGVSLFVPVEPQALLYLTVFCVISFVVCTLGIAIWAGTGHLIGSALANARRQRIFNLSMAILLSGSVLLILIPS